MSKAFLFTIGLLVLLSFQYVGFCQFHVTKLSADGSRTLNLGDDTYLPNKTYTDNYAIRSFGCSGGTFTISVITNLPDGATVSISGGTVPPNGGYLWPISVTFTTPNFRGDFTYTLNGNNLLTSSQQVHVTDTPTVNKEYNFYIPINSGGKDTLFSITNRSFSFDEACNNRFQEPATYKGRIYPDTVIIKLLDSSFSLASDASRLYALKILGSAIPGKLTFYKEMLWNGGQEYCRIWLDSANIHDRIIIHYIDSIIFINKRELFLCPGGAFFLPYSTIGTFNPNNVFTAELSDENGSFQNPKIIGSITAQTTDSILCTIPLNTAPSMYGYNLRLISSNPPDTSEYYNDFISGVGIHVAEFYPGSVFIQSNKGVQVCNNTSVTFTAHVTSEYNNPLYPHYKWYLNGVLVGKDSSQLTIDTLKNNDILDCKVTSITNCPVLFTSDPVRISVISSILSSVTIRVEPNDTLCNGESTALFTAEVHNGGDEPVIQWFKNSVPVGDGSDYYLDDSLLNNDKIHVEVSSRIPCAIPLNSRSNTVTIIKATSMVPYISIVPYQYISTQDFGDSICPGTAVIFYTFPINGGYSPVYQWFKNGIPVGSGESEYIDYDLHLGDLIYVNMSSDLPCASPMTVISNAVSISVLSGVVPTVQVEAFPNGPICQNTEVIFVPKARFGGNGAIFQWRKNGVLVETDDQYEDDNLQNGDRITVTITSSADCASPETIISSPYIVTVSNSVPLNVIISAHPRGRICAGTNVNFTANVELGGYTPIYQWKKNGVIVGSNSPTYQNNSLNTNDVIQCIVSGSLNCASPSIASSNLLHFNVGDSITPVVTINQYPPGNICSGETVSFTATPDGGGVSPFYQWKRNGINVGTNSPTYTSNALAHGDVLTCIMTSSFGCAKPATVISNSQNIIIGPVSPNITISQNPTGNICAGKLITFQAITLHEGSAPIYQWKINGSNAGTTSPVFTPGALSNGSVVTCTLTSTLTCAIPSTVVSNAILINAINPATPSVSIFARPEGTICTGSLVTFSASTINAGSNPIYRWRVNGITKGVNSPVFSTREFNTGDIVSCRLTSSLSCIDPSTANSNNITMSVATTRTVYTFIGSGNWENSSNWVGNLVPPSNVQGCGNIFISPSDDTGCILNSNLIMSGDVRITVAQGKKFIVLGNIVFQ